MTITIESPIKLRRRLRATFFPAITAKKLNELKVEARKSLLTLKELSGKPPLQLVGFYQVVSPWCDLRSELYELERKLGKIDYGQFDKARKALLNVAAQDERCRHGVNRTSRGQRPSVENTFLGNRLGVWTQTVSQWERERAKWDTEPAIIGRPHPTVMEVIDAQASTYLSQGITRWTLLLQALIDS